MFPFLFLLFFFPSPSSSHCNFGRDCTEFCASKRPNNNQGEFHASCELGGTLEVSPENKCLGACFKNKCPDPCCPTGHYVVCPALPKPKPHPPQPRTLINTATGSDQESIGSWIWISIALVATALIFGLIGLGIFCYNRRRRRKREELGQSDTILGEELPPIAVQSTTYTHHSAFTQPNTQTPLFAQQLSQTHLLSPEEAPDLLYGFHPDTATM